jgi:Tfp pilus assembly protein PilF
MRRHPRWSILAALLLALAGAGLGVLLWGAYHYRAAARALQDNNWVEARKNVDQALRVWPRSPQIHLLAARIARLSLDFPQVDVHLKQCKQLLGEPDEAFQLEWLLVRAMRGEIDQVAPGLVDLVRNKHEQASEIFEALAVGYMNEMRWGRAHVILDYWLADEPDNPRALAYRGRTWIAANANQAAQADLERALQINPALADARFFMVDLLLRLNNAPEAVKHLDILKQKKPDLPELPLMEARCQLLQGHPEQARETLTTYLDLYPQDGRALAYRAKVESLAGHPDQAEKWYRQAIQADPANTENVYNLYLIVQQGPDKKEAKTLLDRYKQMLKDGGRAQVLLTEQLDRIPPDPKVPTELGEIYLRLGDGKLASYWLHSALKRDPSYQPAHRLLATYYASINEAQKADAHRRRAGLGPP